MNQPLHAGLPLLGDCIGMAIRGQGDPLAIKRIEREAQRLLDKRAARADLSWLILAFTAFLQGKASECVRCIDAAAKLAPFDLGVVGNAGSILAGVGEPRRALEFGRLQAGISAGDDKQLSFSCLVLRKALYFEEAVEAMRTYRGADVELYRDSAQRLVDLAVARDLSPELRLSLLETAIEAVRSQGCSIRQTGLRQYSDDALRYIFFIDESATKCGSVNFAIAEALTEKFEDTHAEFVTFACRPLSSYDVSGSFIEVAR